MKALGEYIVADIMTSGPLVIGQSERLHDALELFENNRISALPVVDKAGCVVGLLSILDLVSIMREIESDLSALWVADETSSDFIIGLLKDESGNTLVSDIMSSPVETIKATDNVIVAAQLMTRLQYRHLPVVDSRHRPVGMLSSSDFVRAVADVGALMAS